MSTVRELHDEAMRLSQLALVARQKGDFEKAKELARQALKYEKDAADLIPEDKSSEPTRSILYQSSASLAFQFEDFNAARRLIAKGLSGYPPPKIQEKLSELLQKVDFEEHLQEKNMMLEDNDLQLSLDGKTVSSGLMPYSEFIRRIQAVNSIIDHSTQRLMHRPYQKAGRVSKEYKLFTQFISAPLQGSFAITFKLVVPKGQQMSLDVNATRLIDEILKGFELINMNNEEELKNLIKEEPYYVNFVSSSRVIAPDGNDIKLVGLSSKTKKVSLTRRSQEIQLLPEGLKEEVNIHKILSVEGILDYANSRKGDTIGLTAEDKKTYSISVKEGMEDLVRSYYKQFVKVTGTRVGRKIYLTDIEPVND